MSDSKSRKRSGASLQPPKPVNPAELKWVEEFLNAEAEAEEGAKKLEARNEIIGRATLAIDLSPEALGGLKFELLVSKDAGLKEKALALFGKQRKMTTLTGTGDAMEEYDTFHDRDKIEAVDPQTLVKAYKSLEKVAQASQQTKAELLELYAKDFGLDPKDLETIELHKQKKAAAKTGPNNKIGEQMSDLWEQAEQGEDGGGKPNSEGGDEKDWKKLVKQYDALMAKVDKEVRDEVWQPLVRQGLIPENFVPDRHSEVSRTFEAASKLYEERLKEYTQDQGENAEMLRKLGIGDKVSKAMLSVGKAVLDAIPPEYAVGKEVVQVAFETVEIVRATGFQVAGQVMKKDEALSIGQTIASGLSGILKAVPGVPGDVAGYVDDGMKLALTGGRVVKGIMDGKPEDIFAALGDAINQSMSVAATASGNPIVTEVGKDIASALRGSAKAKDVIAALRTRPVDKEKLKQALAGLVSDTMTELGNGISRVVDAEVEKGSVSEDGGQLIGDGIKDGISAFNALLAVAVAPNKAQALADALGGIANDCFSRYLPGDYGATVGASLKSGFSNGAALAKAIADKKPDEALSAFLSMAADGLGQAAKAKGVPEDASDKLSEVADWVKGAKSGLEGAVKLKKAIEAGDTNAMEAALDLMVGDLAEKVLDKLEPPSGGEDDGDGEEAGEDEDENKEGGDEEDEPAAEDEDDTLTIAAQKDKEEFEKQRYTVIENANKILADSNASESEKNKAQAAKDVAVKQLLEAKAIEDEVKADQEAFADMLNAVGGGEDDGDDFDGDTRTLENMIATIKRDRMILDLVDKLSSMGIAAAAHFFPPAGAAMDFKTFAVEAAKTVAHLRQLAIWMQNAKEARNAVTVQVHTMLNRAGLEKDFSIEHAIKATLALVSAVGQVIATVGAQAAPVGVAMAASAKVARTALDAALLVKTEAEMEMAWRQYQKAFKEPRDRKNVRMALQKNPTLAKYGLVWGACKDNNPIAKQALKRCGLTDAIIAKESANENKVVEYLEVMFRDDPVVLRAVPDTDGWSFKPPKPQLTMQCWMQLLAAAKKDGKLAPTNGGALTSAFAGLEPVRAEYEKAKKAFEDERKRIQEQKAKAGLQGVGGGGGTTKKPAKPSRRDKVDQQNLQKLAAETESKRNALVTALRALDKTCKGFKPLKTSGEPHEEVRDYALALAALATIEARELNGDQIAFDKAA